MNWPWRKKVPSDELCEAVHSREAAEEALEKTKRETPAYEHLAERFRNIRQENHFGDAIGHTFRERK